MLMTGIAPMIYEGMKNKFDFFNLKNSFIVYYLLQLAISGLLTLLRGQPSEIGLDPVTHRDAYEAALAISLLGLLAFQAGYYSGSGRPLRLPSILETDWKVSHCSLLAKCYLSVGFLAFVLLIRKFGGLSSFLANREAFRATGVVGLGVLLFPATSLMAIGAMIYLLAKRSRISRVLVKTKIIVVLAMSVVPAFFLGFRGAIALPIIQYMVLWNYSYKRIDASKVFLASVLLVLGFTVYGISREIPPGLNVGISGYVSAALDNPELIYAVVSRSEGTEVVASVVHKLHQTKDFQFGWRSVLETATIAIPKVLWPGKPPAVSERFANYFFADDLDFSRGVNFGTWSGISPTVVGEWYWNFGVIGVAWGLLLLGRLGRVLYATLRAHASNEAVLVCYAVMFASFTMFAESQQNYLNGLVLYGGALWFSFTLLARGSRTSRSLRRNISTANK